MSTNINYSSYYTHAIRLTFNWFSKPDWPMFFFDSLLIALRIFCGWIWVSPQIMVSNTASWISAYWSLTEVCQMLRDFMMHKLYIKPSLSCKSSHTYRSLNHFHPLFSHLHNDLCYVHLSLTWSLSQSNVNCNQCPSSTYSSTRHSNQMRQVMLLSIANNQ